MSEQVVVQNLTNDEAVYIDNDGGIARRIVFHPQQSISLPRDLIERMEYDRGGSYMLKEILSVKDESIRENIGVPADQIEYDWTVSDVDKCLNEGTLDELRDALDFAPQAIRDLIVVRAVALPINNRDKAAVISDMTGKNLENMIANKKALEENSGTVEAPKSGRRVQKKTENTGRRVQVAESAEE